MAAGKRAEDSERSARCIFSLACFARQAARNYRAHAFAARAHYRARCPLFFTAAFVALSKRALPAAHTFSPSHAVPAADVLRAGVW